MDEDCFSCRACWCHGEVGICDHVRSPIKRSIVCEKSTDYRSCCDSRAALGSGDQVDDAIEH